MIDTKLHIYMLSALVPERVFLVLDSLAQSVINQVLYHFLQIY